jgi:hypothetical protein
MTVEQLVHYSMCIFWSKFSSCGPCFVCDFPTPLRQLIVSAVDESGAHTFVPFCKDCGCVWRVCEAVQKAGNVHLASPAC